MGVKHTGLSAKELNNSKVAMPFYCYQGHRRRNKMPVYRFLAGRNPSTGTWEMEFDKDATVIAYGKEFTPIAPLRLSAGDSLEMAIVWR
jgi:hypothetical protein